MTPPPLLSVIIPHCNNAVYLDECLDSVLAQTYRALEVVIVDDSSDDGSAERIRAWREQHPAVIRPLFLPARQGVSRARNTAIEQSRGAFLTTLDSDDYYADARKLEQEMELLLAARARCEAVIAFSDIALVRADRTLIALNSQWAPVHEGFILADILARTCLIPRDFVVARAAYETVGVYDPRLGLYEDWELKIRLAERYPFRFSGITGTAYRRHGRGLSSAPPAVHAHWLTRVFEQYIPRIAPSQQPAVRAGFALFLEKLQNG